MSDIAKQEFAELAVSGKNYMTWTLDAKIMLGAKKILKIAKKILRIYLKSVLSTNNQNQIICTLTLFYLK